MMADGGETDYVVIEPSPVATFGKRRRRQFGLLGFLVFTCLAGATLGIAGRQWLQERRLQSVLEAELAAFQGRWELESSLLGDANPTSLVVTGDDFLLTRGYGKIHIDVTVSPKTVDLEQHPFDVGPATRTTCQYSFEGDRLKLRLVGKSRPDGSYTATKVSESEIVFVREHARKPDSDQE